jgi:hypothetical protein
LSKSGIERRLAWQFLGTDPELVLAASRASDRAVRQYNATADPAWTLAVPRDPAAAMAKHAAHLREVLAELAELDEADDHLPHLAGSVQERAAELADALAGRGGCAAELSADVASLTARIKALLACGDEPVADRIARVLA